MTMGPIVRVLTLGSILVGCAGRTSDSSCDPNYLPGSAGDGAGISQSCLVAHNKQVCPLLGTVTVTVVGPVGIEGCSPAIPTAIRTGDKLTIDVPNGVVTDGSTKWVGCYVAYSASNGYTTADGCNLVCSTGGLQEKDPKLVVVGIAVNGSTSFGPSHVVDFTSGRTCFFSAAVNDAGSPVDAGTCDGGYGAICVPPVDALPPPPEGGTGM